MRHGILKVRLDDQLRGMLREQLSDVQVDQPDATLSSVARNLLREALAQRAGRPLSTADHGYFEGFARASAAVRRAVNEALHAVAVATEEP
jgi:hypothetical protein